MSCRYPNMAYCQIAYGDWADALVPDDENVRCLNRLVSKRLTCCFHSFRQFLNMDYGMLKLMQLTIKLTFCNNKTCLRLAATFSSYFSFFFWQLKRTLRIDLCTTSKSDRIFFNRGNHNCDALPPPQNFSYFASSFRFEAYRRLQLFSPPLHGVFFSDPGAPLGLPPQLVICKCILICIF
jgi:hypothetical protein